MHIIIMLINLLKFFIITSLRIQTESYVYEYIRDGRFRYFVFIFKF